MTNEITRTWRKEAKLSLRNAAEKLGIDFTYLSKIENGHLIPSVDLIEKMGLIYLRSREETDSVCISRGSLPNWVVPLILSNPHILHRLRLDYRLWQGRRSAPPKEYA